MGIKRVVIPVIVALGAAGSILSASAIPTVTAGAPAAHVVAMTPQIYHQG